MSQSIVRAPWFVALAVAIMVAVAAGLIDREQAEKHRREVGEETAAYAVRVRADLESALNRRVNLVRSLAAWVRSQPEVRADNFAIFARELYEGQSGIRSIQLAPDSVVTHVYPLAGNEAAVGHDLLADPARRDDVKRAIDERRLILAGPVTLRQGGQALIGRIPIYTDVSGSERYWGLAIVLIDFPSLLEEAGLSRGDREHAVAIRSVDTLGNSGTVFYGVPGSFGEGSALTEVRVPQGGWQLAARPRTLPGHDWPGRDWFVVLAGLLLGAASYLGFLIARRPLLLQAAARQAIDAMHGQERQFQQVAESAHDAVIIADDGGHIRYWNQAACELFGYLPREVIGKSIELIIPPEQRELHRRGFEAARLAGDSPGAKKSVESVAVTRSGTEIPVELTMSSWAVPEGRMFAVTIRDIRARKALELEREKARVNLTTMLDSMDALVYIADMRSYEILFINAYGRKLFGEIQGRRCWESLQTGQTGQCEFCTNDRLVDRAGLPTQGVVWEFQNTVTGRWFQCHDRAISWFDGRVVRMEIATDIDQRKRLEQRLGELATHDALTGLPNRRLLFDRLGVALAQAKRQRITSALMFIDLDGFKPINDRLGHDAGDECLREVARRLRSCVRESDTVARFGGDEFLILLSPVPHPESLTAIAEKILHCLAEPFDLNGETAALAASIGIAVDANGEKSAQALLREADEAMYRVKSSERRGGLAFGTDSPVAGEPSAQ